MSAPAELRYFDLNTGDILEQWEPRHAVRELIANALDEQAISETADIEIEQVSKDSWCIRDFGRGIAYDHLRQDESAEKRKHAAKVIGKFGFGLKDALATLNRRKIGVEIRSRHGLITLASRAKHGFGDVASLHAVIAPPLDARFVGTEVLLSGIATSEVEAAKQFFLRFSADTVLEETPLGQILEKPPKGKARVYMKGLLIAEEENFLFSYNVTSLTKQMADALNRERTNVGRSAYSARVRDMLLKARSEAVANALAREMDRWQTGGSCDELKWDAVGRHAIKILSAQGNVMLVASSASRVHLSSLEDAESDGYRIVTVPDTYLYGASEELDLNGNPMHTVERYMEHRSATFQFAFVPYEKLRAGERAVFDQRQAIAALIGGLPQCVKGIEVTETMRPDYLHSDHTQGLWDPVLGKIIIHRNELKSLPQFAGTLLHEIVHARTGHDDVSRAFEDALTDCLGMIGAKAIASPTPSRLKAVRATGKAPQRRGRK